VNRRKQYVILGLSITSSWGNGHATTYRGLVRELVNRGNDVLFLERDVRWYAANRDLSHPPYCRTKLYSSLRDLKRRFANEIRQADVVIVGSYVPEGVAVGEWVTSIATGVTAFYDIDTPVTLRKLQRREEDYLTENLIPRYSMYLSFSGGRILELLEREYGAQAAFPLYCSVDVRTYAPEKCETLFDIGYMGTYSDDRQPRLDKFLFQVARKNQHLRSVVAGPQYPASISWPSNVKHVDHLPPSRHCRFYNTQRFTLNITRDDMVHAGWSPSIRLFEAAACGVPIISDYWQGIGDFFRIGKEILIARSSQDVQKYLHDITDAERRNIGKAARQAVLREHTASHRAQELEYYVSEVSGESNSARAIETDRSGVA
jgi:spore maturation protein CgeB